MVATKLPIAPTVAATIPLQSENPRTEAPVIPKKPRTPKPSKAKKVRETVQATNTSSGQGEQLDEQQSIPPKRKRLVKMGEKETKLRQLAKLVSIFSPKPISHINPTQTASPPKTVSQTDKSISQSENPIPTPTTF